MFFASLSGSYVLSDTSALGLLSSEFNSSINTCRTEKLSPFFEAREQPHSFQAFMSVQSTVELKSEDVFWG